MTSTEGRLTRAARWIEENRELIAGNLGPIFLAGSLVWVGLWAPPAWEAYSALVDPTVWYWAKFWTPWIVLTSVATSLYGSIGSSLRVKRSESSVRDMEATIQSQANLSNRLEEAQLVASDLQIQNKSSLYDISSDYLGHMCTDHLEYNDTERSSLYLHTGSSFELVGRFSKNREYRRVARTRFPDNEGCIGQTWAKGGRYFAELPDDEKEYYETLKADLNIDKGVARALRMPSKVYCSSALVDGYARIGVLVFESTRKGILDEEDIHRVIGLHKPFLVEMLKRYGVVLDQIKSNTEGDRHD